jgi:hypothetical protein
MRFTLCTVVSLRLKCLKIALSVPTGIPPEWCVCARSPWSSLSSSSPDGKHLKSYAAVLVDEINSYHNLRPQSTCMDVTFSHIDHAFVRHERRRRSFYMIRFHTHEGPSTWEGIVSTTRRSADSSKIKVMHIEQVSRYQKHDVCRDARVPLPFCICKQFHWVGSGKRT